MKTRFDLEQQITQCWNLTDDLDTLIESIYDGDKEPTLEEICNALIGMKQLCEMRFHKLFKTFEKHIKEIHESQVCDNSEVLRQEESVAISSY